MRPPAPRRLLPALPLLAAATWGCAEPEPAAHAPPFTVQRDSAGVAIVETPDLSGVDTLAWVAGREALVVAQPRKWSPHRHPKTHRDRRLPGA